MFYNPYPDRCGFHIQSIIEYLPNVHRLEHNIALGFGSSKRSKEFLSGRSSVHHVFESLGLPNLAVLRNRDRSPVWPLGLVGCVSHGAGLAAAMVAKPQSGILGLGLDVEDLTRKIDPLVATKVFHPFERSRFNPDPSKISHESKICFSAKESIFKCFYPLKKIYLDFLDAEILELEKGRFSAVLFKNPLTGRPDEGLKVFGNYQIHSNVVLTCLKWPLGT